MFFQVLLTLCRGIFKIAVWALVAFTGIPLTILLLVLSLFPDFSYEGGIWFWLAYVMLNFIAFCILWKPLTWTVTTITRLCEGFSGKKQTQFSHLSAAKNDDF